MKMKAGALGGLFFCRGQTERRARLQSAHTCAHVHTYHHSEPRGPVGRLNTGAGRAPDGTVPQVRPGCRLPPAPGLGPVDSGAGASVVPDSETQPCRAPRGRRGGPRGARVQSK